MSEQEDRRFYYFYNENFAETEVTDSSLRGQGLDAKLTSKVFKVLQWYYRHLKGLTGAENKVYLLTSNAQTKVAYERLLNAPNAADIPRDTILDVNDFVTRH